MKREPYVTNLLASVPGPLDEEWVEVLVQGHDVRVERIVSTGHTSPEGFWYDSPQAEWVAVLTGEAKIRFADDGAAMHLRAGDCLTIPAHRKHRVDWTAPDEATVWLAVYFS